ATAMDAAPPASLPIEPLAPDPPTDLPSVPMILEQLTPRRLLKPSSRARLAGSMSNVMSSRAETPEVEVLAKAARRRFTAEYKRRILREAAACSERGELGALLRREGLYSSQLTGS